MLMFFIDDNQDGSLYSKSAEIYFCIELLKTEGWILH